MQFELSDYQLDAIHEIFILAKNESGSNFDVIEVKIVKDNPKIKHCLEISGDIEGHVGCNLDPSFIKPILDSLIKIFKNNLNITFTYSDQKNTCHGTKFKVILKQNNKKIPMVFSLTKRSIANIFSHF